MSLTYDKLSDSVTLDAEVNLPWAAYWNYPYLRSSRGRYIGGSDTLNTSWVVDVSEPPQRKWKADFTTEEYLDILGDTRVGLDAFALDDEGSMWGKPAGSDGVVEVPLDSPTPQFRYEWVDASDASAQSIRRMWAYTLPNESIFLLILPIANSEQAQHRYYTAVKGFETLHTNTSVGWRPSTSFQDDNGDVWLVGIPDDGQTLDSMTLTRLTDVTSGAGRDSPQVFDVPEVVGSFFFPVGLFADGAFIGGIHVDSDQWADTLFRAELDGSLDITTSNVAANPVQIAWPGINFAMQNRPDPTHIFVLRENSDDRVIRKMLPDLTFSDSYDLDDWAAGDHETELAPETVFFPLYSDYRLAFYGTRYQYTDPPDDLHQTADLFIYYFGEASGGDGGDGLQDTSVRLRVWGFGLDGHKHVVWRVGPSETLVFDPTTRTWSSWASPGRNNWRAHVGQNWLGMSTDTLANGFGSDIVAGDDASGVLWILDPTSGRDDRSTTGSDPFNRVATGGLPLSGRETVPCGALQLECSLGNPTQTGATFHLETSDDWGNNFDSMGTVTVAADDFTGTVEWRGLGTAKAPGRVFRITDNGAAVRLSGADLR